MLSSILTTSFLLGAAFAAQTSSPTVVCVAGQCLEGFTNTTSAYTTVIARRVRAHLLQLARLCPRLGPQPTCSCYRDSTRLRPTRLFFMTSLRPQAHQYPAHQGSMPTRHCLSTSLCSPEWRSTHKRITLDKQPLPSFPAHHRTAPPRSPPVLSQSRQTCG